MVKRSLPWSPWVNFFKLALNYSTAFPGEEFEQDKLFIALNLFTQKSIQKSWALGAILEHKFQEIDPLWLKLITNMWSFPWRP